MLIYHMGIQALVPQFMIVLPAHASQEMADDGSIAWAPATHVTDLDGFLGSWFQPDPDLAIEVSCFIC